MNTQKEAMKIAEEIVNREWLASHNMGGFGSDLKKSLIHTIARAITPPTGHVRLPSGEDVRVLGELPMTADRCVIAGPDSTLYHRNNDGSVICAAWRVCNPLHKWYSTREAAESARSKTEEEEKKE